MYMLNNLYSKIEHCKLKIMLSENRLLAYIIEYILWYIYIATIVIYFTIYIDYKYYRLFTDRFFGGMEYLLPLDGEVMWLLAITTLPDITNHKFCTQITWPPRLVLLGNIVIASSHVASPSTGSKYFVPSNNRPVSTTVFIINAMSNKVSWINIFCQKTLH